MPDLWPITAVPYSAGSTTHLHSSEPATSGFFFKAFSRQLPTTPSTKDKGACKGTLIEGDTLGALP